MTTVQWYCAAALAVVLAAPAARAQEAPKPGPEHAMLKKHEGTWDTTMKMMGAESKGTATYKMDLGGLWLVSTFEGDFGGAKFTGKGLDSYDPATKKYVSVWFDSMSTRPLAMEGTYDEAKKTLTMTGQGPGMDGKPTTYKGVSEYQDDNTMTFTMYVGGVKEPAFSIVYKRKK